MTLILTTAIAGVGGTGLGGLVGAMLQKDSNKTVSLLLKNFDVANHGQTPVSASVYVKLADGTVIESAEYTYAMKDMVEQINEGYTAYSFDQLKAVAQMIQRNEAMQSWNVANILASQEIPE